MNSEHQSLFAMGRQYGKTAACTEELLRVIRLGPMYIQKGVTMSSEHQSLVAHATEVLALAKRLTEQQKQEEAHRRQDHKDHAARVSELKGKVFAAEVKIGELERLLRDAREREHEHSPRQESRNMEQEIHSLKQLLRASEADVTTLREKLLDSNHETFYAALEKQKDKIRELLVENIALGKQLHGAQIHDAQKEQDVVKDLRAQLAFEKTRADGNWAQSEKWRAQCAKAHETLRVVHRSALNTLHDNNSKHTGRDVL